MKASEAKLNVQNYQKHISDNLNYTELFERIASVSASGHNVLHDYYQYVKTHEDNSLPNFAYRVVDTHLTSLGYKVVESVDQFDTDYISWYN
jgi:ABC-type Zn2+ transport system substrate-binding protein/surface adhesin